MGNRALPISRPRPVPGNEAELCQCRQEAAEDERGTPAHLGAQPQLLELLSTRAPPGWSREAPRPNLNPDHNGHRAHSTPSLTREEVSGHFSQW